MKKNTSAPANPFSHGLFGGANTAQDGFDFLKRMWGGGMTLPGMMTPTTDLAELEKRIADLKAVEQWLNLNLSMLRATIQGLEVQHGTLAALQAFGSSLSTNNSTSTTNSTNTASPKQEPSPQTKPSTEPKHNTQAIEEASTSMVNTATAWWNLMQEQFNTMAQAKPENTSTATPPTTQNSTSQAASATKAKASRKKTAGETNNKGKPPRKTQAAGKPNK